MSSGGLIPSKPRPRAGLGFKRIDQIVNLARTPLKRRLIAFGVEMEPKESKFCCSIFATIS